MPDPLRSVPRWRRALAVALIVIGGLIRLAYAFRHAVNTDEPQHLHVAWGWTQGLLIYRDIFDNHSPLFSMAYAPLLAAFGERSDIVVLMRIAMIPLALITLWALWAVVRRLYGPEEALWAVALAGVYPDFVGRGVEYRSDVLWMALWMATLAVLMAGRLSRARLLAAGVLLGATFGTSMKTSLLALALTAAVLTTAALLRARGIRLTLRRLAASAGFAAAGAVLVPGIIVGWSLHRHVLDELYYCVVLHNVVPGIGNWGTRPWLPLLWIPAAPVLAWIAMRILRAAPDPRVGARRAVLFLTAAIYWVGAQTLWPLVTRQDWLPFAPMAAAAVGPLLTWLPRAARARSNGSGILARALGAAPAVVVIAEIALLSVSEPLWKDRTREERQILGEALRLTAASDSVMDLKGEAIYRARPYYYVLEPLTIARIQNGVLGDDIPERLISSRTAVVYGDSEDFPPRARRFMNDSYISVGWWRVAGCLLRPHSSSAGDVRPFTIRIPQRYRVVTPTGAASGRLDGAALHGTRDLAPGAHTYQAAPGEGAVAVLWSQAAERGFTPFSYRPPGSSP